jgi:hypothetical protein
MLGLRFRYYLIDTQQSKGDIFSMIRKLIDAQFLFPDVFLA